MAFHCPPEEPKPTHSYIGIIAMAILNSKEKKLVLSDIYQWILDNYPYFRRRGPGWRNSIRHNLSLNDCFVKSGRSANGKGHYWAVHPANVDDFQKGDFRRRRAQRKVRR
ncbi:hypothetical protein HELRODRAFT_84905, partial [Helobdella robusta]|uniref:Fork-head domain-containing protein n=1 Tax=Helobdella robusta TaxID=6412 RepID=T1G5Q2_HELRO